MSWPFQGRSRLLAESLKPPSFLSIPISIIKCDRRLIDRSTEALTIADRSLVAIELDLVTIRLTLDNDCVVVLFSRCGQFQIWIWYWTKKINKWTDWYLKNWQPLRPRLTSPIIERWNADWASLILFPISNQEKTKKSTRRCFSLQQRLTSDWLISSSRLNGKWTSRVDDIKDLLAVCGQHCVYTP